MGVVDDPNLSGLEESMQKDGDLNAADLQARINVKREARYQDEGLTVPPGLAEDVEPLPEVEVEAPPETPEEETEPDEPEPEEGPEQEEPEGEYDEEEEFYAARYKTREAVEAGLAEKDRLLDMFFRQEAERTQEQPEQEGPQELDIPAWNEWAEQAVSEGRGITAAQEALQAGGADAYDIYYGYWAADPDQAPQAHAFNNWVTRYFADERAQAATAPLMQRDAAVVAKQEAEEARQIVASQYEDFAEHQQEMDRLIRDPDSPLPEEARVRLQQMSSVGLVGKVHAWDYLYQAARATQRDTQGKKQRLTDGRRKAAAERAKIAATVSSSEGAQARTPLSEAESYVVRRKNAIRQKLGQPLIEE